MIDFVAVIQERRRHKAKLDIAIEDDNSDGKIVEDKFEEQRQQTEAIMAQRQRKKQRNINLFNQKLWVYQSQMNAESSRQ